MYMFSFNFNIVDEKKVIFITVIFITFLIFSIVLSVLFCDKFKLNER